MTTATPVRNKAHRSFIATFIGRPALIKVVNSQYVVVTGAGTRLYGSETYPAAVTVLRQHNASKVRTQK